MAKKEQEQFTVTDRRLFTSDGELRKDIPEEPVVEPKPEPKAVEAKKPEPEKPGPQVVPSPQAAATPSSVPSMEGQSAVAKPDFGATGSNVPPPPTATEQKEQA